MAGLFFSLNKGIIMKTFFWIITILCSLIGALVAFVGVSEANGAPQEAAAAAMGIAFVVIPYCLARAVSEISSSSKSNTKD